MKKRNIIIVFAIAACFVMAALPAVAATTGAWTTAATNVSVIIGANPAETYTAEASGPIVYTISDGESGALVVGGFVTLKLTGGAVFTSTSMGVPTLTGATGAALAFADGGTAGYSYAKFVVMASPISTGATISFPLSEGGCLNVSAVTNKMNVDANLTIANSSNINTTTEKSLYSDKGAYLFTGENLFTIFNNNNEVKTDTADVLATSGAFTKFVNNTLVGSGTTFTTTSPTISATKSIPGAEMNKKKILVTLSGDFNGIAKITNTDFTGSDSTGAITGVVGQFSISADKTKAYAVYNQNFSGAALTVSPRFYIDGTTAQAVRSFTLQFENLDDAPNYVATTWQSAQANYKILRNGVSFAANSLGPLNTVKITDKSGNVATGGAKVIITAYDVNGTKLAEVAGAPVLLVPAFGTLQLTGDVIAARFTGTPMLYDFAVASTNAVITNVKKTAEGFGSTVYTNTNNDVAGGI